jgi:uncharacterized protein (DUF2235 family)
MPNRNVVVCCDGTANEFAKNKTNVLKLYFTLNQDLARQITYYHPGIGTMEPAGALTTFSRKITKLMGQAVGYGLENDIRDAYVFLMREFRENDSLFLFGFSRGAYTARAIASLLRMYGLIRRGDEALVPYAIRMLMGLNRAEAQKDEDAISNYFKLAEEFKSRMCAVECRPHFVGVWDTVSSVGWVENPLRLPCTANNPDIEIGRHAISIDERRAFFRTNLWIRPDAPAVFGPKDLKQVWFAGVHCDVGGGYAEAESGLAKIALDWMLQEAKAAGLLIDQEREKDVLGVSGTGKFVKPDAKGQAHKSLTGLWNLAEFIPKRHYNWKKKKETHRMNLYRRRTIPAGSLIHNSVFQRGGYDSLLPEDAKATSTLPTSPVKPAGSVATA